LTVADATTFSILTIGFVWGIIRFLGYINTRYKYTFM
jgi:hypothetical protein